MAKENARNPLVAIIHIFATFFKVARVAVAGREAPGRLRGGSKEPPRNQ